MQHVDSESVCYEISSLVAGTDSYSSRFCLLEARLLGEDLEIIVERLGLSISVWEFSL
jgi:hypothetical protein